MAKTLSFGVMHVCIAFGVSYALSGNVAVAGAVTLVEPLCNMIAHHVFDGWWTRREAARAAAARPDGAVRVPADPAAAMVDAVRTPPATHRPPTQEWAARDWALRARLAA